MAAQQGLTDFDPQIHDSQAQPEGRGYRNLVGRGGQTKIVQVESGGLDLACSASWPGARSTLQTTLQFCLGQQN